jgi:peroxiredoxin Q/BCP
MPPSVRKPAPAFSLPDAEGNIRSLGDYRGKWVLVYFYPKDDTPGCTKEACGLRDLSEEFLKRHCIILGISTDSPESHQKFTDKYKLPYILLSDTARETVQIYGVRREKKFMGKSYMGTVRTSFLIDPEGTIAKIYENVRPEEHAADVLADVEQMRRKE